MSLTPGDTFVSSLFTYISSNSTRLASSPLPQPQRRTPAASSARTPYSYTSYLLPPSLYSSSSTAPKPLALRITPQNLFYLLLRFQAIGLEVGELDVPLGRDVQRAMSLVEVSAQQRKKNQKEETGSFRSVAGSVVSGLSLGGWWGTGAKVKDPDSDLKLIYSAFSKLPYIVIHSAGLDDDVIEEMAGSGPLDTAVPLKVFKNLQVLEIVSLPPSALIIPSSHILRSLTIRAVDSPLNDEEGEWLVPVLFGEKEGVVEQRRRERMVGPSLGVRNRQPSAASGVMGGVGEDDEEEKAEGGDASKLEVASSSSPPSVEPPIPSLTTPQQQLKFPHLSHLALPSLSLLTLPVLPVPSLLSLDLSNNLLLALPPNLVHFPNLLALNLEGNMINSLRGADQLLPSTTAASASSAPPSSFRNGTPSRAARPPPSRTGLRALNLDANRISNLHGLSGLTSLQRLSLRNNSISESLELSRLTALPVLVDLYVLPNPFSTNAAEQEWRVRLWEGFARESREETACPKVDGEGVTWSEKRRMKVLFPTDGGAARRRASRAEMETPNSPPVVPVAGGAAHHHARKASTRMNGRVASSVSVEDGDVFSPAITSTSSSPPSSGRKPAPPSSYHPPASSSPRASLQPVTTPRQKRRHRRIVNLDGQAEDSGAATGTDLSGVSEDEAGTSTKARHQRGASERPGEKSTAVLEVQEVLLAGLSINAPSTPSKKAITSSEAPTTPNHSSLRSPPSSTARSSARRARLSSSVYEPSSPPRPSSPPSGPGSGDEFRKKLEAMRMEVGDSWLRVLSAAERKPGGSGSSGEEVTAAPAAAQREAAAEEPLASVGEGVGVTKVVKKKKKKSGGGGKKGKEAAVEGF